MAAKKEDTSSFDILNNALKAALGVDDLGTFVLNAYDQGVSLTEIIRNIRYGTDETPEGKRAHARYLQAYPKMDVFIKNGVFSGGNPEAQYLEYRKTLKQAATSYGLLDTLVTDDKIASYIEGGNSAAEIVERMNLASRAAATTPPETMKILEDYYGVKPNDITSFFLDPEVTRDVLQSRYAAANIGMEAARQRFGINEQEAYALAQTGMTRDEANRAFQTATEQQVFMSGPGETINREDIMASISGDAAANQKIERVAGSRAAKFQGGGEFMTSQQGVTGLGQTTTR